MYNHPNTNILSQNDIAINDIHIRCNIRVLPGNTRRSHLAKIICYPQKISEQNQTTAVTGTYEQKSDRNKYEVKVYLMHFIFLFYSRKPTPESMPTWIIQICFQRNRIKLLSYKTYKMESYLQKMKLYRKKWHHHCRLFIFTKMFKDLFPLKVLKEPRGRFRTFITRNESSAWLLLPMNVISHTNLGNICSSIDQNLLRKSIVRVQHT